MLVMRPLRLSSPPLLLRWKGTPSPTHKEWITRSGFYAAKFWHPQKRKASTPLHRGPKCRCLLHSPGGRGGRRITHAVNYTTARCRQCVAQRENLWFSTLCTFSQRAKAESLQTRRALESASKNKGPSDRPGPSITVPLSNRTEENTPSQYPPKRQPRFDHISICPAQLRTSGLFVAPNAGGDTRD
jgi:hypothetical protein